MLKRVTARGGGYVGERSWAKRSWLVWRAVVFWEFEHAHYTQAHTHARTRTQHTHTQTYIYKTHNKTNRREYLPPVCVSLSLTLSLSFSLHVHLGWKSHIMYIEAKLVYIYGKLISKFPLKMLPSWYVAKRKMQLSWYLAEQIQLEIFNLYPGTWFLRFGEYLGGSILSGNYYIYRVYSPLCGRGF